MTTTPNYGFQLPDFDQVTWHDAVNGNFEALDTLFKTATGLPSVKGAWMNSISYIIGDRVLDPVDTSLWIAKVAHTSPAIGTFAAARLANPTYWDSAGNGWTARGQYLNNTDYRIGDTVFDAADFLFAVCEVEHTSPATGNLRTNIVNFEVLFDGKPAVTASVAAKNTAETAATNAGNSATAAAGSATSANTSKNAAATSATNAATSETNASNSATTAGNSATSASNSATTAVNAATTAVNAKNAAQTSAINAATSEANAAAYAASIDPSSFYTKTQIDTQQSNQNADINTRALKATTITVSGLAVGGGDLSTNRSIDVPKSTNAQAVAGTDDTTAMTPVRTKEAIAANSPVLFNGGYNIVSLALNTAKQNILNKAIFVSATNISSVNDRSRVSVNVGASAGSLVEVALANNDTAAVGLKLIATAIVGPGQYYSVTAVNTGSYTVRELA